MILYNGEKQVPNCAGAGKVGQEHCINVLDAPRHPDSSSATRTAQHQPISYFAPLASLLGGSRFIIATTAAQPYASKVNRPWVGLVTLFRARTRSHPDPPFDPWQAGAAVFVHGGTFVHRNCEVV